MIEKYSSGKIPAILDKATQIANVKKFHDEIYQQKQSVSFVHSIDERLGCEESALSIAKTLSDLTKRIPENCTYDKLRKKLRAIAKPEQLSKEEFVRQFSRTKDNTVYLIKDEEIKEQKLEVKGDITVIVGRGKRIKYVGIIGENFVLRNTKLLFEAVEHALLCGIRAESGTEVEFGTSALSTIANSTFSDSPVGFALILSHECSVLRNTVFNCSGKGIDISLSTHNTLTDNKVYSNSGAGMDISGASNVVIRNSVTQNTHGITISGEMTSRDNIIASNDISSNREYGIFSPLKMDSDQRNIIANNTLTSNGADGISMKYSHLNVLKNNTVTKSKVGIRIKRGNNNFIVNNVVSKNDEYGIYLEEDCLGNRVNENFVDGNTLGIYLFGGGDWARSNYLQGNAFYKNAKFAIFGIHHSALMLNNNVFAENGVDMRIWECNISASENNVYPSNEKSKSEIKDISGKISVKAKSKSEISELLKRIKEKAGSNKRI